MIDNNEKEKIRALLREFAGNNCLVITPHFSKRMKKRGVVLDDVSYAINWGEVVDKEYDSEYGDYKYTIKGVDIDGDDIILITVF